MDNLATVLDVFEADEFAVEKQGIEVVNSDESAEKIMQKIAWVEKKKAEKQSQYDMQMDFINRKKAKADEWLRNETESLNGYRMVLENALRPYIESRIDGKKAKSVKFIDGKAGIRAGSKKFYIGEDEVKNDNESLVKFTESSMPELIKVKKTVDWATLKKSLVEINDGKVITKDGEIVPDMKVVQGEDKFYVEV